MRNGRCPLCGRIVKSKGLFVGGTFMHLGCYLIEIKCPHCGKKVAKGKVFTLQRCPECGMSFRLENIYQKRKKNRGYKSCF